MKQQDKTGTGEKKLERERIKKIMAKPMRLKTTYVYWILKGKDLTIPPMG